MVAATGLIVSVCKQFEFKRTCAGPLLVGIEHVKLTYTAEELHLGKNCGSRSSEGRIARSYLLLDIVQTQPSDNDDPIQTSANLGCSVRDA